MNSITVLWDPSRTPVEGQTGFQKLLKRTKWNRCKIEESADPPFPQEFPQLISPIAVPMSNYFSGARTSAPGGSSAPAPTPTGKVRC